MRRSSRPTAGISTVKAGRNRLIANNEVRAHSLHRTARLRLGIIGEGILHRTCGSAFRRVAPQDRSADRFQPDMRRLHTRDVKAIWIGENRLVTIT